jgi:hypothetical protein
MEHAIDLWRELLRRQLPQDAYRGFGWFAMNERVEEDTWLELTAATSTASGGNLDEPERVAERATRSPTGERAVQLVASLLEGDPSPWDLERIGEAGVQLLRNAAATDAGGELRERLLERGFHAAADFPEA